MEKRRGFDNYFLLFLIGVTTTIITSFVVILSCKYGWFLFLFFIDITTTIFSWCTGFGLLFLGYLKFCIYGIINFVGFFVTIFWFINQSVVVWIINILVFVFVLLGHLALVFLEGVYEVIRYVYFWVDGFSDPYVRIRRGFKVYPIFGLAPIALQDVAGGDYVISTFFFIRDFIYVFVGSTFQFMFLVLYFSFGYVWWLCLSVFVVVINNIFIFIVFITRGRDWNFLDWLSIVGSSFGVWELGLVLIWGLGSLLGFFLFACLYLVKWMFKRFTFSSVKRKVYVFRNRLGFNFQLFRFFERYNVSYMRVLLLAFKGFSKYMIFEFQVRVLSISFFLRNFESLLIDVDQLRLDPKQVDLEPWLV